MNQASPSSKESTQTPRRRRLQLWVGGFGVWTALALLSTSQGALFRFQQGQPVEWGAILIDRCAEWYTCAVFTPLYFWMAHRYPIDRQNWRMGLPVHLAVTAVVVVLRFGLLVALLRWLTGNPIPIPFASLVLRGFIPETIAFWAMIGVIHAVVFYGRYREREVQAATLRAQLAESKLDALIGQLHPHFLFNTLQGISTLIHRDAAAADLMLRRLSELLRQSLRRGSRREVTLGQELELALNYVGIVRLRFEDRLSVNVEASPELRQAMVPHFLLQPLVENAIEHGIAQQAGAGRIAIRAERENGRLLLFVENDGPPISWLDNPAEGVGLSNTRRRLEELYGSAQELQLEPLNGRGLRVRIALPYRQPAPAAGEPG